jgi:uncharacterized protein (TIGR02996 family)
MTTERAFLADIVQHPDDDAPRLVFADWLEDQGDSARAEFIRVQCELARLDSADERYPDLNVRQLQLLAEHERDWLGEWADRLVRWEFRRGLLHEVTIQPEPFVTAGAGLLAGHPIHTVAFVDERGESLAAEDIPRVVAAPHFGLIRGLELSGCRRGEPMFGMYGGGVHTNTWLAELANARHITRLESLGLHGGTRSGREMLESTPLALFCAARHLHTLRRLDLSSAYPSDDHADWPGFADRLANASFTEGLRSLSLEGCELTNNALARLAAGQFRNLEALHLGGCDLIRSDGLRALLSSEIASTITDLSLPYGPELAAWPGLGRVRTLRLSGYTGGGPLPVGRAVPPGEWEELFRSPRFRPTRLSVSAHTIPDEAIGELLEQPWVPGLRELVLSDFRRRHADPFDPLWRRREDDCPCLEVFRVLGDCRGLPTWPGLRFLRELSFDTSPPQLLERIVAGGQLSVRLTRLDVTSSCQTLEATRALGGCSALRGLRALWFQYNDLAPEMALALAGSANLRQLETLALGSVFPAEGQTEEDTAQAVAVFAAPGVFPRLRDVEVGSETVSVGVDALLARFGPRLRVWHDC